MKQEEITAISDNKEKPARWFHISKNITLTIFIIPPPEFAFTFELIKAKSLWELAFCCGWAGFFIQIKLIRAEK